MAYQSIIRDPGGDEPVRLVSLELVVDGSILIVPADTEALFVLNGQVSDPYPPGRWTINTGVNPFFVRFRNLMTAGDPGINVQVFFVNTQQENTRMDGTGGILFKECRFNLTMRMRAAYTMRYVISNPRAFVSRLVGMHHNHFSAEDISPAVNSMIMPLIKDALSVYAQNNTIQAFQSSLTSLSSSLCASLRAGMGRYGIDLKAVSIVSVNVDPEDLKKLREFEEEYAKGKMETDLEVYNVKTVYGDIDKRTFAEMATHTARGPAQPIRQATDSTTGFAEDMATLPMRIALMNRALNQFMPPMDNMLGGAGTISAGRTAPPDLPRRLRICPGCNRRIDSNDVFCRYCGRQV